MTLDEAIIHAKEISENQYACEECHNRHHYAVTDKVKEIQKLHSYDFHAAPYAVTQRGRKPDYNGRRQHYNTSRCSPKL